LAQTIAQLVSIFTINSILTQTHAIIMVPLTLYMMLVISALLCSLHSCILYASLLYYEQFVHITLPKISLLFVKCNAPWKGSRWFSLDKNWYFIRDCSLKWPNRMIESLFKCLLQLSVGSLAFIATQIIFRRSLFHQHKSNNLIVNLCVFRT